MKSKNNNFSSKCLMFIAFGTFFIYIIWNLYWFTQGRLAPSMLLGFTGIPAPTTGMTRSFMALLSLDIQLSLSYNPFTLITIALIIRSSIIFINRYLLGKNQSLSYFMQWSWIITLSASWLYQLVIL